MGPLIFTEITMADRITYTAEALDRETVVLFGHATIGATGAPTLVAADSKGIASITRNSAGDYTVVLQDTYPRFLGGEIIQYGSTSQDLTFHIKSHTVSTTKQFNFVCKTANTATDPTSGTELYWIVRLKNSSQTY